MSRLMVTDITVPGLLERLRKREWLVPGFQRDFVWSMADVVGLVVSIFDARPIGMATLWEQGTKLEVELVPISIPDSDPERSCFADVQENPSKVYAILDGRQRCTALAMAFGGLRAHDGKYKYSGRYYLDVGTSNASKRVCYLKESEVRRRGLLTDANCVGDGLFPLASNNEGEEILPQWMRYIQAIRNPSFYPNGELPPVGELDRRDGILKRAFEGLVGTKLAVYVVPDTYHLAAICDIFETLNTTGTPVSPVDLIHSWLYSDTYNDPDGALLLRDWISDFGEKDGAIGWASELDRPELTAQIVTACYVALETKPDLRPVSGNIVTTITSIKSADLLATPTLHWKNIIHNDDLLAEFLGDFQNTVAGGYFPYSSCPYPVSAAIYVALRWHAHFDGPDERRWGREDLDAVFRAFFWRNALSNRYDQGFLSQLGTDIKEIKSWLCRRADHPSANRWAIFVHGCMVEYMPGLVSKQTLVDWLSDGKQTGALQKTLILPMVAGAKRDLLDPTIKLSYPSTEQVELHHIYPKAWCNSSKVGELAVLLNRDQAGRNWVDSAVNLMPMSRKSNNLWKAKVPGQVLVEMKVTYQHAREVLKPAFIDEEAFQLLMEGPRGLRRFWELRAELMADDLLARANVTL
jgi:hypothetical protein